LPNSKIIRTAPETQEEKEWIPPAGTLASLVAAANSRSARLDQSLDKGAVRGSRTGVLPLSAALKGENVAIIAEIKRSSPSKGSINPDIESGLQARAYEAGGASAISVLTEPDKFGGSDDDIAHVMASSALPVLKKDFHVTELQIIHAASLNVAAALVIVRALSPAQLEKLARAAKDVSLELVFEVRDELELERALNLDAQVIGVNNRNLETLDVDAFTVERIVPLIPRDCLAIAESGYSSAQSIASAAAAGTDAVLIGSHVSASADPARAIREIASIPKTRSGRRTR
jgi:indole-3-glycerol phosphate synthase